jgi:hypothetical protein
MTKAIPTEAADTTMPATLGPAPGTREEHLLDEYFRLVESDGANSDKARDFRERNKNEPGFAELVKLADEMEASRRKALWGRRAAAVAWILSAAVVGVIAWVAVQRALALNAHYRGLNQPNAIAHLETKPSPIAYTKGLAKIAIDGADTLPNDPILLAQRIGEYRLGCTRLIHAEMRPLGPEGKKLLQAKCRLWGEKLSTCLYKIDQPDVNVADIKEEAKEIIDKIPLVVTELGKQLEAADTSASPGGR